MKFALFLILGNFCLNQVTLSSATNFEDEQNGNTEFSQQHKTELDDLSVELQLMMLEKLNLIELINMSSTNEHYRQLGADVFRRKIEAKTVIFGRRPYYEVEQFKITSMNKESIYIENYDVMLTMLKNFGHLLTTLEIDYGCAYDVERRKQMTQYASKYCSETLFELNINSYREFKLDYFPLPFKRLEKLSVKYMTLEANETSLDQKFPAVHHLKLKHASITEESVSGGEFPHLKYLSIDEYLYQGLETLILKSPNLQSLQVAECPYELLSFVNKNAPQLVELRLLGTTFKYRTYLEDVMYRFENVKKLVIKTTAKPPRNFYFEQLEDLRIESVYRIGNEWFNFIVNNTNIKRFELVSGWLDNHKLEIIAENLKNLEDATIDCDSGVQTGTITQFVNHNDKLRRLKVTISKSISSLVQADLRTEWNLIGESDIDQRNVELSFEKK